MGKNYDDEMDESAAVRLSVQALLEVVDSGAKNMEISVVRTGGIRHVMEEKEIDAIVKLIEEEVLCDFSSTWTGFEAKIIDECVQSNSAPIKLNHWDVLKKKEEEIFSGTVNPSSSKYCLPLPGIGTKTAVVAVAGGDGALEN